MQYYNSQVIIAEMWEAEYTDEFAGWWRGLSEEEQESVAVAVEQLE